MNFRLWRAIVCGACAILALPAIVAAQAAQKRTDNYEDLYARYLEAARTTSTKPPAGDIAWMASLTTDLRARQVNDLVTIRVVENIAAAGTAGTSLDKNSSGSASVSRLFGVEGKLPGMIDPTSLASAASDTQFKGAGNTSRTGTLSAVVTARVVEVLPNGDLVLEGAREVDINGDRQVIVLTGVLRTADILPGNTALSTSVGQLRIRYFGRGLMKDNLKPGWLIRVLNKIF